MRWSNVGYYYIVFLHWKRFGTPSFIIDRIEKGLIFSLCLNILRVFFLGQSYNTDQPVPSYFPIALNYKDHTQFIVMTLEERIENDTLTVLGRVWEVELPILVMPNTIELSKPTMSHDERFFLTSG